MSTPTPTDYATVTACIVGEKRGDVFVVDYEATVQKLVQAFAAMRQQVTPNTRHLTPDAVEPTPEERELAAAIFSRIDEWSIDEIAQELATTRTQAATEAARDMQSKAAYVVKDIAGGFYAEQIDALPLPTSPEDFKRKDGWRGLIGLADDMPDVAEAVRIAGRQWRKGTPPEDDRDTFDTKSLKEWYEAAQEAYKTIDDREALLQDCQTLLSEAKQQIDYLHGKFQETGTGNATLTRIDALLARLPR